MSGLEPAVNKKGHFAWANRKEIDESTGDEKLTQCFGVRPELPFSTPTTQPATLSPATPKPATTLKLTIEEVSGLENAKDIYCGAGAVIVRVNAHGGLPRLIWAAAMSLRASSTTNNQAEYFGLLTGLRAARRCRFFPLTVIGDSALIIRQVKTHRAPRDPTLRRLYAAARVDADVIQVQLWCHHVRLYNKMADAAANRAMDSRKSFQTHSPTSHIGWEPVATHLDSDVAHWQAHHVPATTSSG